MEQEKNKKRCYKCLLRETDPDVYFKNLHDYIENLDEEIKASKRVYDERLAICKECDYLENGMCRACGCFVELRASIKSNVCSYAKW